MYSHHRSDSIFNYFRESETRASTENDRDSYQMQLLEKLDADEFLSTSFLISFTHGMAVSLRIHIAHHTSHAHLIHRLTTFLMVLSTIVIRTLNESPSAFCGSFLRRKNIMTLHALAQNKTLKANVAFHNLYLFVVWWSAHKGIYCNCFFFGFFSSLWTFCVLAIAVTAEFRWGSDGQQNSKTETSNNNTERKNTHTHTQTSQGRKIVAKHNRE